jgi:hypothetical protein
MYLITSIHEVVVDSYEHGETESVNFYTHESRHKELNNEAIAGHFSQLGFSFDADNMYKDEDRVYYSWLVNSNDEEASESERQKWMKDKLKLYGNNASVTFQQLIDVMV